MHALITMRGSCYELRSGAGPRRTSWSSPQIGGWWAQTVTVSYERIRGLRQVGQNRNTGLFMANKSRTLRAPIAAAYAALADQRKRQLWWDGEAALRSSRKDVVPSQSARHAPAHSARWTRLRPERFAS